MRSKYSGRRPENQPVFTEPRMLDFEKRRMFIPVMHGSPAPHPSLEPSRFNKDVYYKDYGLNWKDLGAITPDIVADIVYLGKGIVILADVDYNIWRSIDFGATWESLGMLVASSHISSSAYLGSGIVILGGHTGHIYRSVDWGVNWTDLGDITGTEGIWSMSYLGNSTVLAGDDDGHIWSSTDDGATWADVGEIATMGFYALPYLGTGIVIGGDCADHIWRSTDYGQNWTDLGALAGDEVTNGVYLGNGVVLLTDLSYHVYRSTNYGLNWTDLGAITSGDINTITHLGNGVVVLGDSNWHIWRSIDYGKTWADLGEIATNNVNTIVCLENGIALMGDDDWHVWRSVPAFHVWKEGVRKANDVEVAELAGATYDDVQDFINMAGDRTLLSGGTISAHGDADGSVAIAACTAWAKETDSDIAIGKFFDYAGKAKQTLTDLSVNLIYLDYNADTPQIVVATAPVTYGFQQDHILVGVVFRQGTAVHIFQSSNVGIQGINRAFMHAVEHHGAHRSSGLVTSDGGTLSLSITAGVIYAGLNRQVTTVDGTTWSYWWTDDSGSTWTEDTGISALVQSYNNIATGKVSLGTNKYGVHWVYVDYEGSHVHIVYGQGNYTAPQAEAAGVPAVLPPIVVGYGVLIAKIINQEGTNTLTITYPWTTVFPSSLAQDHGNLSGLADDDHLQYIKHSLATAISNFLVASGAGVFIKKTLAEVKTLLGIAADIATHAAIKAANATLGHVIVETASKIDVDGNGKLTLGGDVLLEADLENPPTEDESAKAPTSEWAFDLIANMVTPIGDYAVRQTAATDDTPFDADIAGAPSATEVVYDGDSNEGCLESFGVGGTMWGRVILHNTTRSNSRKIVSVDTGTKTITTESSSDDWADNDVITTASQTNAQGAYCDLDLSAEIPATARGVLLYTFVYNPAPATGQTWTWHPYEAYNAGKRTFVVASASGDREMALCLVPVIDQKVTFRIEASGTFYTLVFCKGYV